MRPFDSTSLKTYQEYLKTRDLSDSSLKRKFSSLRKFSDWAYQKGILGEKPESLPAPSSKFPSLLKLALVMAGITFLLLPLYYFFKGGKIPLQLPFEIQKIIERETPPSSQPAWIIHYQGKLTSNTDQAITSLSNVLFSLYDQPEKGYPLWTSNERRLTPDEQGNITVRIGDPDQGDKTLRSDFFFQKENLYLSISVNGQETKPRLRVATAANAANAYLLDSHPPQEESGPLAVPVLNKDGTLTLSASYPKIKAQNDTFVIEGQAITLQTPFASDGDITLSPDGAGTVKLIMSNYDKESLSVSNANLSQGSLISGVISNDSLAPYLISLSSGSEPSVKFYVDAAGNTNLAGKLQSISENLTLGDLRTSINLSDTNYYNLPQNVSSIIGGITQALNAATGIKDGIWTDGGSFLYPTNRESLRVYDSGRTKYLDISHDGTNAKITTSNTGQINIDKDLHLDSSLSVGANAHFDGNLDLGNASDDQIVFYGKVKSHLLPYTDDIYDLGSSSYEWRNLYLDGTAYLDNALIDSLTLAGNITMPDDSWLGLGASAGRIEFDDQTTDEVNILDANVGMGTSTPNAGLEVLKTTEQLRLSSDATNYTSFTVSSLGDLTINPTGGQVYLADSDVFNIGGVTGLVYNAISDSGTTSHSLASDDDLFIEGDFEVDGTLYADGNLIAPSTGVSGYWRRASGALSPANITDDLLMANSATASAYFWVQATDGQTRIGPLANALTISSDGYLSDADDYVTVNDDLSVTGGDITGANSLGFDIGEASSSAIQVTGHLIPSAHNNYDLGADSHYWRNLYLTGSTIYFDDTTDASLGYSSSADQFQFNILGSTTELAFNTSTLDINLGTIDLSTQATNIDLANSQASSLTFESDLLVLDTANDGVDITTGATTTDVLDITANSLTSGKGLDISSTAAVFTGSLANLTLSGSNANNTGSLLRLDNTGTLNANTTFYIDHRATGTGNLAIRVDDESGDTSPFVIDGAGQVGIGTTAPSALLDVAGDASVSGSLVFRSTSPSIDTLGNRNLIFQFSPAGDAGLATKATLTPVGNLTISGDLTVSGGDITGANSLGFDIGEASSSAIQVTGHLIPSAHNTYDLGADSHYWRNLYLTGSTIYFDDSTDAQLGYSTTSNELFFDPDGNGTANVVFEDSGKVGIGTTTPSQTLDIVGNATASGNLTFGGQLQLGRFASSPTAVGNGAMYFNSFDNKVYYYNGSSWIDVGSQLWQRTFGALSPTNITDDVLFGATATASAIAKIPGLSGEDVWFNTGGNLGIGTTAPLGKLHVTGAVTGKALAIFDETGNQNILSASVSGVPKFTVSSSGGIQAGGGTPVAYSRLGTNTTDYSVYLAAADDLLISGSLEVDSTSYFNQASTFTVSTNLTDDAPMIFGTGLDASIRWITSDANDFLNILTNVGNANFSGNIIISEDIANWGHAVAANPTLYIQSANAADANDYLRFYHDDTDAHIDTGSGDLALTPANNYHVTINPDAGGDAALIVDQQGLGDLFTASASGVPKFVIKNSGDVGIGTTGPSFRLDVQDSQAATVAAQIYNTATDNTADGLLVKLGITSNPATGNRFLEFQNGNGVIVGSVAGNGSGGVTYNTSGVDFAEYFEKEESEVFEEGDLICLKNTDQGADPSTGSNSSTSEESSSDTSEVSSPAELLLGSGRMDSPEVGRSGGKAKVTKCKSGAENILGVVSAHPGFTGGSTPDVEKNPERYVLVGLIGQIPIKVSDANGPVRAGDPLTFSKIPGVAVKATKEGQIVGKALESLNSPNSNTTIKQYNNITIKAYIQPSWYDPDVFLTAGGDLKIINPDEPYEGLLANENEVKSAKLKVQSYSEKSKVLRENTRENTSESVEKIVAAANGIFARVKTGLVETTNLLAENVVASKALFDQLTINYLTINNKLISPIVETNLIKPLADDDSLSILGNLSIIGDATFAGKLVADSAQFNHVNAQSAHVAGNLTAQQFNNSGNATISGQLTVKEASISGELFADSARIKKLQAVQLEAEKIKAETIDLPASALLEALQAGGLEEKIAAIVNQYAFDQATLQGSSEIPDTPDKETQQFNPTSPRTNAGLRGASNATTSALLASIDNLQATSYKLQATDISSLDADSGIFNDFLAVLGQASIVNLEVTNNLVINDTLHLTNNSIGVVGNQCGNETMKQCNSVLYLQPLGGSINILAGKFTINENGDVYIAGDLKVDGKIVAKSIEISKEATTSTLSVLGDLSILGNLSNLNASLDASGTASFKKLIIASSEATPSGLLYSQLTTNATTGEAILPAYQNELTIYSSQLTPESFVYLTPASDTENKVLYVKAKNEEFFKVAIDKPVTKEVKFYWWIIN